MKYWKPSVWLLLLAIVPTIACAQWAYTAKGVNLRAGPARDYPLVARLPAGVSVALKGCLPDYRWCDVAVGRQRGWVYAGNLVQPYRGVRVPVLTYGAVIGVGVVAFSTASYWDAHYVGRPWYRQRQNWVHRPVPGYRPPPGYRPGPPPPGHWQGGGQRPPHGQRPESGQRPPQGQWPEGGQRPPQGQWPESGQRPPHGQRPDGGQRPPQGQPPGNGQRPPQGQQPDGGQRPPQGLPPGNGQRPPQGQRPDGGQRPPHGQPPGGGQRPPGQ